jgi:MFS family permease
MWVWVPALLLAAYERAGWSVASARLAGFAVIAAGAVGCVLAGAWADRIGRVRVTSASLAVSGSCCLVAGPLFDAPGWLTAVCLLWGMAVIADSAQFSAALSELADARLSALPDLQTCVGFLLTLVPPLVPPCSSWSAGAIFVALARSSSARRDAATSDGFGGHQDGGRVASHS